MPYQMTINRVKNRLVDVFKVLDGWFDQPAACRAYHPTDDGWSIDEILEHVTLTSHFLLIVIRKGCAKALKRAAAQPIEGDESDLDRLAAIGHPDAFGWIRPEHMQPTGEKSPDEIRQTLRPQCDEGLSLLEQMSNGEGSLYKVRMSVQELGKMDMYQWLYFLALHAQRHAIEIERIASEWQQKYAE